MEVTELAPGLWRWTAPHPTWTPDKDRPGGWARMVGCLYLEPPAATRDALVLIDPLAPPDGTPEAVRFWGALDADVKRLALPIAVLVGNEFHGRSADAVRERYARLGVTTWALPAASGKASCSIDRVFEPGDPLPGGVEACAVSGLDPAEVAYWIGRHSALAFADAVIGAGEGRLRVAPRSWAPDGAHYDAMLRASLRRLLDLPVESVLTSHGEPVLSGGCAALAAALSAPAWGED
jgi:hypothetical protein